jgi:hypothetical protein
MVRPEGGRAPDEGHAEPGFNGMIVGLRASGAVT